MRRDLVAEWREAYPPLPSPEANDFNLMTGESQKCRGIFITLAPLPLGFKDY